MYYPALGNGRPLRTFWTERPIDTILGRLLAIGKLRTRPYPVPKNLVTLPIRRHFARSNVRINFLTPRLVLATWLPGIFGHWKALVVILSVFKDTESHLFLIREAVHLSCAVTAARKYGQENRPEKGDDR